MGKNGIVVAVSALLAVAMVVGVVVGIKVYNGSSTSTNNSSNDKGDPKISTSNKSIQDLCQPTTYKETCVKSLSSAAGNTTDLKELVKIAFRLAKEEVSKKLGESETIKAAQNDPRGAQALKICQEVIQDSIEDLERSLESINNFSINNLDEFLEDLKVWVGGAATSQDVCFDAFEDVTGDVGEKMRNLFKTSREMTSNVLTMISEVKNILGSLSIPGFTLNRKLLAASIPMAGEIPAWISENQRQILNLPTNMIKPDAIVSKDGSGQFKTISEALAIVPKVNVKPFIIYIKAGVYAEYVLLDKKKTNVVFIGDGPTMTKITGNKSFKDGIQTYLTSTVAIMAPGFMAKDIGFENTAGPEGHQAVALRVVGDYAVFSNCQFDGYQDTLYTVRGRQFYRDCVVSGTIDFIFGDAQVVFQNCKMIVRKPLPNQFCMVTAQGRNESHGPGVTVLQGCHITGEPALIPVKNINKAFLGRPWKEFSRTIIMESVIDDVIAPEGWTPWKGTWALDTLFYAEYNNKGAGALPTFRVQWPGIKNLTPQEVENFTPEKLYKGSLWVQPTGALYIPGFLNA